MSGGRATVDWLLAPLVGTARVLGIPTGAFMDADWYGTFMDADWYGTFMDVDWYGAPCGAIGIVGRIGVLM